MHAIVVEPLDHDQNQPQPNEGEPNQPEVPPPLNLNRPHEEAVPNRADVPWDTLFPRKSRFRDAIVKYALPPLLQLLRDPANRLKSARDLVNKALDKVKESGNEFWGQYEVYTRRRSACDAIITHYFSVLQDFAAGRAVAPL